MRTLLLTLAFAARALAVIAPVSGALTSVAISSSVTTGTTTAVSMVGATLIVVNVVSAGGNTGSVAVSDSISGSATSNTWHALTKKDTGSPGAVSTLWYAYNSSGG